MLIDSLQLRPGCALKHLSVTTGAMGPSKSRGTGLLSPGLTARVSVGRVWSKASFILSLSWMCPVSSSRRETVENKGLLYLHGDWEVSPSISQSDAKGSIAEMSSREGDGGSQVEGMNGRARVTASWRPTPLEEATDVTHDRPAETPKVRRRQ